MLATIFAASLLLTRTEATAEFRAACLSLAVDNVFRESANQYPFHFDNSCFNKWSKLRTLPESLAWCEGNQHPQLGTAHLLVVDDITKAQALCQHMGNTNAFRTALMWQNGVWGHYVNGVFYPMEVHQANNIVQWMTGEPSTTGATASSSRFWCPAPDTGKLGQWGAGNNQWWVCQFDDPAPTASYRWKAGDVRASTAAAIKSLPDTASSRDCAWLCQRDYACASYAINRDAKICVTQRVRFVHPAHTPVAVAGFQWYDKEYYVEQ